MKNSSSSDRNFLAQLVDVLDVRETVILFGHCDDSIIAFPHFLIALLAFNDSNEPTLQNTMQLANSSLNGFTKLGQHLV